MSSAWFDADSIQSELDKNLPNGLRMLADAIESEQLDGRLIDAGGVAGGKDDDLVHVLVRVDIAVKAHINEAGAMDKLPMEDVVEGVA